MIVQLLLFLSGVSLYAGISHLLIAYQRPVNRMHLLFSATCVCSALITFLQSQSMQALSGPQILFFTRWSLTFSGGFYLSMLWFICAYARYRPLPVLYALAALLLLFMLGNFAFPYSLQFSDMPAVRRVVYWGDTYALPTAIGNPWYLLVGVLFLVYHGFILYALARAMRSQPDHRVTPMVLAVLISFAANLQGMLIRMGWVDSLPLGALSFSAFVLVMSPVLRYEMNQRVARMSGILNHVPASVYLKDLEGHYVLTNHHFDQMRGQVGEQSIGKTAYDIFPGERAQAWSQHDQSVIASGRPMESEYTEAVNGRLRTFRAVKFPLLDAHGAPYAVGGITSDITEIRHADEHIRHLAHFDQLTGLANRVTLESFFQSALQDAQRAGQQMAVMFLDIDHFKYVNDTLGHTLGDQLLAEAARRMQATFRAQDLVARLGGDDFVFVLPDTDASTSAKLAEQLQAALAQPFQIEARELSVTASIGIALYPDDGTDWETLSRNADTAMYKLKHEARNGVRFYTASMKTDTALSLRLSNDLKQALQRNQLTLHYQPQMDLQDGRLIGAEALLRWNHPELGPVSPAQFIPIAESSGLIIPIGEWVLRTAARQAKSWLDQGLPPLLMAVNLSVVQFRHTRLLETISAILSETGLPASALELELTEAVAMDDPLGAMAVMDALHQQGVHMSIDDFGTGYSSLSYLKRFKVSKLKIDQSFVRDIHSDPEDQAIVSAIISMARSLGMQTIAEGVESAEQLAFLRANRCSQAQGYFYSRPVPAAAFEAFMRQT